MSLITEIPLATSSLPLEQEHRGVAANGSGPGWRRRRWRSLLQGKTTETQYTQTLQLTTEDATLKYHRP